MDAIKVELESDGSKLKIDKHIFRYLSCEIDTK